MVLYSHHTYSWIYLYCSRDVDLLLGMCETCETSEHFSVVNMSTSSHEDSGWGHLWLRRPGGGRGFKSAASQAAPDSNHWRSWESSWVGKAWMEIRMFLGLAIGLMAMSAVSAFRDNGPQQKWSPYKPRWLHKILLLQEWGHLPPRKRWFFDCKKSHHETNGILWEKNGLFQRACRTKEQPGGRGTSWYQNWIKSWPEPISNWI